MTNETSFTTRFSTEPSLREVFDLINDVRGWWEGEIEGAAAAVGDEFTYRSGDLHRSTQRIAELVPGERIVWRVTESHLSFVRAPRAWDGTEIVFEIRPEGDRTEVRFTHVGLVPGVECYDACSRGWSFYVGRRLRARLSGAGDA